ncbi:MAG: MFS transporter [Thaumarchaeota archaeon]|nr:MFS transporter [Nitrososphaerota archaeon]
MLTPRVRPAQSQRWMLYILPGQITNQGLNIVIPLYVIALGGGIGEVAILVSIQNAAVATGSLFWGRVIDRLHAKRPILLISFLAVLICSLGMYFTNSIAALYAIVPIIGFFIVGRNPVTQLLVMESIQKNLWSWLFARTSVISTLGMLAAMAIGFVDSLYLDLKPYFLICAVSSGTAMALSLTVGEGKAHIERSGIAHSIHGLRYAIGHHHFVFPRIPELHDFKHIMAIFRGRVSNEIGIFYMAIFFFNLGSNMYSTAWSPFLITHRFSNSGVFLNYMVQMTAMLLIYFAAPRIISRLGEDRATLASFAPRILAVLIPAAAAPFLFGSLGAELAVASSCLLVIGFSIFSTSSSVIFFKSIPQGFEGKYLGVNSAVTGIGVFTGALVTGELTKAFGYQAMFLLSASVLSVSVALFGLYFRYRLSHRAA